MVSRENKRAAVHEKLQLLRSITNSHALSETSIIVDASKYIEKLKHKVERLNEDIAIATNSSHRNSWPVQITVKTLEKGFLVNLYSEKSCPGLLVYILEAFEEIGLNVLEARVSCADSFQLEAVGGGNEENIGEIIDDKVVQQAVSKAIKDWTESSEED